jgi:hypothetical protein
MWAKLMTMDEGTSAEGTSAEGTSFEAVSPVVLRATPGGRWFMFLGFSPVLFGITMTALVWGMRSMALPLAMAALIWMVVLRIVHREIEFSSEGIRYRGDFFEHWFPSEFVRHLRFDDTGRKSVIWLPDGSVRILGVPDFYYGPHKAERRQAVRDMVADRVDADYARTSGTSPVRLPRQLGASGRPTRRFARLNATEWVWLVLWLTFIALFLVFSH